MRTLHWLFLVSVLLFVSGIGFVIAAGRTARLAPAAAAAAPAAATVKPVATVRQLMIGMVGPAAETVWNSVSTIVSVKGIEENQPRTDEEWEAVAASAAVLIESAAILASSDRAVDKGEWVKISTAMGESSKKALAAAQNKDPAGILAVGEEIYTSCTACHEQYSRSE